MAMSVDERNKGLCDISALQTDGGADVWYGEGIVHAVGVVTGLQQTISPCLDWVAWDGGQLDHGAEKRSFRRPAH